MLPQIPGVCRGYGGHAHPRLPAGDKWSANQYENGEEMADNFTRLPQGEQVCLAHVGHQVEEIFMLCKEIVKVLHRKLAQLDNRGGRGSAHAEPI